MTTSGRDCHAATIYISSCWRRPSLRSRHDRRLLGSAAQVPLEEPDRRHRLEARQRHVLAGVDVQRLLRRRERVEQGKAALARDVLVVPLQVELDRDGDPPAASTSVDGQNRPKTAAWISGSSATSGTPIAVPGVMPQYDGRLADLGYGAAPREERAPLGDSAAREVGVEPSTIGPMGSPTLLDACRTAAPSSSYGVQGRGPWPSSSSATARRPTSVSSRARPDLAGWCRCCLPLPCPSRTTGVPGAARSGARARRSRRRARASRVVTPSDVVCETEAERAGLQIGGWEHLSEGGSGAPSGYPAAHPVTQPGDTHDGTESR